MNKHIRIVISSMLLSALAPLAAIAASDMYIKISDVKGESRVVHCLAGTCAVSGLAAGSYQVQVCDEKGVAVSSSVALSHSVTSPRDSASGLATGKRMHKPMTITKELDKSSPKLYGLIIADQGSQVVIQADDYNSSRSNKTSN